MSPTSQDVTVLLERARGGSADALSELFPVVYAELRAMAGRQIRREYGARSMDATDLVHEAYCRLVPAGAPAWEDRAHFFGVAARSMRQVLIDRARARKAGKRGGSGVPVTLTDQLIDRVENSRADGGLAIDVMALDEALTRLGELDPECVRMVELRFFAGLSIDETAKVLDVSPATLKRRWTFAQTWLRRELGG